MKHFGESAIVVSLSQQHEPETRSCFRIIGVEHDHSADPQGERAAGQALAIQAVAGIDRLRLFGDLVANLPALATACLWELHGPLLIAQPWSDLCDNHMGSGLPPQGPHDGTVASSVLGVVKPITPEPSPCPLGSSIDGPTGPWPDQSALR